MTIERDILRTLEGDRKSPGTHMHIVGSSGLGKSKFVELLLREALLTSRGFCFLDWHGTTYSSLVRFLAYMQPKREIVLLNPSQPDYVVGFNPFIEPGEDISTTVARRIDATVKPWGAQGTDRTPTLERVCRILYHFAIAANETLPNAALLLDYSNRDIAEYALRLFDSQDHLIAKRNLSGLLTNFKTANQWQGEVGSTNNRVTRFIGPKGLRRFIGRKEGNINIAELMDRNAIVLVNLAASGNLDNDPARVFAAMLLNEFFAAAMRRAGTDKHFFLALDEFQEYITYDLAAMLAQVRKGGLHVILAHQFLEHLNDDRRLRASIFTNCLVKAVFGGLAYDDAETMTKEVKLDEINERQIVETYYRQEVGGHELMSIDTQSYSVTESHDDSYSDSIGVYDDGSAGKVRHETRGHRNGASETKQHGNAYFLKPTHRQAVAGRQQLVRDEKISIAAGALVNQPPRHCTIRMNRRTFSHVVPEVREYRPKAVRVDKWTAEQNARHNAITGAEADQQLAAAEQAFLERVRSLRKTKPPKSRPETPPRI